MAGLLQRTPFRSLAPWAEMDPFGRLNADVDQLLSRFNGDREGDWPSMLLSPPLDLTETEDRLQLRMDLPGVDPKEIDIQVKGNHVTITGERKEEQEEKGETFHRIERRSGRFSRSIMLPCSVNEAQTSADYHDGVLTISIPKSEAAKAQRVAVKAS